MRRRTGRPAWPLLTMLKALLLQQWYGLSDPRLEEARSDRRSFRSMVGRFRTRLANTGSTKPMFRVIHRQLSDPFGDPLVIAIHHQLEAKGLTIKTGTLNDATLAACGQSAEPNRPIRRSALHARGCGSLSRGKS